MVHCTLDAIEKNSMLDGERVAVVGGSHGGLFNYICLNFDNFLFLDFCFSYFNFTLHCSSSKISFNFILFYSLFLSFPTGFLAAHLIGQHPDIFKVACMRNPVTDIPGMLTVTDIPGKENKYRIVKQLS